MFKDCEHLSSINDNKEILDFTYNEYLDNFEDKEIDNLFDTYINNEDDKSSFYDNIGDNQIFNSIEFNTIKEKRTNNSTILFFQNKLQNMKNIDVNLNTYFSGSFSLNDNNYQSSLNSNYITSINKIFYNCKSLITLPDISKWNISQVRDLSMIFYNCSSLKSLPDISKWNTNNVINMEGLFYNCSSLISLPDISDWNTSKVKYMNNLFYNCSLLISLPDISK